MKRNLLLGSCLAVLLTTVGCQDQRTEPSSPATGTAAELTKQPSPLTHLKRQNGKLKLPPSAWVADLQVPNATRNVIDPGDYVCDPNPSPVISIFINEFIEFATEEPAIFDLIFNDLWADLIPGWEAQFLLTEDTPQSFGYRGQYTKILEKTERDTKRFWDIPSDDILLLAMKGTMLNDPQRVATTYQLPFIPPFFGLSEGDANFVAGLVRDAMLQSEVLNGGNHSLFSFNAFAFGTADGSIQQRIVMGDAIMEAYDAVGFGDVAHQAIYVHEFGHHIQFENDYFSDPVPGATTVAELTRYTELMADAMAGYYLTHSRGAAMNRKRVEQFLEVFFQVGDCAFFDPGHHGTPNQRMAAARFGFDVADQAHKQGHILTSEQFHDLFVAAYPQLIAPDAT